MESIAAKAKELLLGIPKSNDALIVATHARLCSAIVGMTEDGQTHDEVSNFRGVEVELAIIVSALARLVAKATDPEALSSELVVIAMSLGFDLRSH